MSVKQVLTDARNLIEEKGWIKGNLKSEEGYCVAGAIAEVLNILRPNPWYISDAHDDWTGQYCVSPTMYATTIADDVARVMDQSVGMRMTSYNDNRVNSKAEALRWLDRVIASLE